MSEFAFRSASELAQAIRSGEISSLELTDYFIARIEKFDGEINAVVVRDFERARDEARRADLELAEGSARGPLHGVPMTIKESYDIAGLPTTWGFEQFQDNIASSDSLMVERFKDAGAIFLGKTNVPVALGDLQSYNPIYGTTSNPWNLDRTPGGSSGGAAAALAAGLTGLETGSDIGGSIRTPAHFNGVYGHKPTWGVVPEQGHALPGVLATPDIAVCGPLARSAEDLALSMSIVSGAQPLDQEGWQLNLPKSRHNTLADFRVAIWPTDEMCPVDTEIADRAVALGDTLRKLGARVSDLARPQFDVSKGHVTYLSLLGSVMGADLSHEQWAAAQAAAKAIDPDDKSNEAVMARATVLSHRGWLSQNNRRERLRHVWRDFFTDWDILICPQTPTPAFPHDHRPFPERTIEVNGKDQPYFDQLFWSGVITTSYLPSTVFPTGPSEQGLPIGLQAIGAEYHDYMTIEFARLIAAHTGGFSPPDGYF
jgi:amidase